jgi:hypothetical protein
MKTLLLISAMLLAQNTLPERPGPAPHGQMQMPPDAVYAFGVICDTPQLVKDYIHLVDEENLDVERAVKQITVTFGKNDIGQDPCARNRWLLVPSLGEKPDHISNIRAAYELRSALLVGVVTPQGIKALKPTKVWTARTILSGAL